MMARLKVRLRGKTVSEIPLAEDRSYTAGRKEDCDIRLQGDKGISREHFRLSFQNGNWTIQALSRFGDVLVAGEKVSELALEHAAVFSVPPYEFEFLLTTGDAGAAVQGHETQEEGGDVGRSEALETAALSSEVLEEKTVVGVAPSVPYIKVMDSQGEPKELIRLEGGDSWTAGRDATCNIHIRDSRVSRRQFEIRKNGSQYSILDLGSVNGTLVNGNPISTSDLTPLKSGDAISVLENYLYFELHDPNFKSRLDLVNLQPLPEPVANPLVPVGAPVYHPVPAYPPPGGQGHLPVAYDAAGLPVTYDPHAGAYAPAPPLPESIPPATGLAGFLEKIDYERNKKKILLGAVALLAILFMLNSGDSGDQNPQAGMAPLKQDPLSKLTPEQRKLVKDTLQLAKSYYMQGKYEFARTELNKMVEIIPEYEDSRALMNLVEEALYVQAQHRKEEELAKARAEQEEKIRSRSEECRKLINPDVTKDQMESCLSDVMIFQPDHPLFMTLFAEVDRIVVDRQAQAARKEAYEADVQRLKGLYASARRVEDQKNYLGAISAYGRVVASTLPDPGGLRGAARGRIAELRGLINSKTEVYQKRAEKFAAEENLKGAILELRKARQVDPTNDELQPRIDAYIQKLKERMMVIYQEGVLEESFGNVEGGETKQGAKDKWKKIIKEDIPDGEYYKKSLIKLKKYGAM